MKNNYSVIRFIISLFVVVLLYSSCENEPTSPPVAIFRVNKGTAEINEYIKFSNRSRLAEYFEWNFGDGNTSDEKNPKHYYSQEGEYTVQCVASNEVGTDDTTRTIVIIRPEILWPAPGQYKGLSSEGGLIAMEIADKSIEEFTGSFFVTIAEEVYELTASFEFGQIAKTDSGFIASYQDNILTGSYQNDTIRGTWKHDYGTVSYTSFKQ